MTISCSQCQKRFVNADDQLIMRAVHHGYREAELNYTWQLFLVAGGSLTPVDGKDYGLLFKFVLHQYGMCQDFCRCINFSSRYNIILFSG